MPSAPYTPYHSLRYRILRDPMVREILTTNRIFLKENLGKHDRARLAIYLKIHVENYTGKTYPEAGHVAKWLGLLGLEIIESYEVLNK